MNYSMVIYVLRHILLCEGALMLMPALTALIYRETSGFAFVICIALCLLLAFPFKLQRPERSELYNKDGLVTVALSWIVMSVIGTLPFVIDGCIPSFIDALFETVSGFTTTGASILSDVDALPHCMLFWRSFTHWIGGMGVLVFVLTVLPASGQNMNLMRAESPGPSVDKLVPKIQTTAKILYSIYVAMTLTQMIVLIASGMPAFDAITVSFGTAGTGGFAPHTSGMTEYTSLQQTIVTVFMILFGVNFNSYFLLLHRRFKKAFSFEVITYFVIIAISITVISFDVRPLFSSVSEALHHSAFQVGSIITTTGFATVDFNLWGEVSKTVLVMLMFIGACAGSTGGGIKVSRIVILIKTIGLELYSYVHPRGVRRMRMDSKSVPDSVVRAANVYIVTYVLMFVSSLLLISFDGKDLVSNFTAVTASFNNIGPGLGIVGPMGNYADFSVGSKLVLIFDMLAGRLELFPMLMLLYHRTWKKF